MSSDEIAGTLNAPNIIFSLSNFEIRRDVTSGNLPVVGDGYRVVAIYKKNDSNL